MSFTDFIGFAILGGFIGMTAGAAYLYYLNVRSVTHRRLEMRGAVLATYPMLLAERDRAYLKQLRVNREEERELMKNVPGWKVGTWYGEPIYHLTKPDDFLPPKMQEYFVHSEYKHMKQRADLPLWS